jgi:hypothetical protein
MQNVLNFPYFIVNATTGAASAFATFEEAQKALVLLDATAGCYVVVDLDERCIEEI